MTEVLRRELRWRRLWAMAGLALAVAIAVVCLVPSRNLPQVGMSDKLEHALAFAALGFWFGSIVVRRDLGWLALALVVFGGLIELAQAAMGVGRQADLRDLLADGAGAAAGLLLALTPLGRWPRWFEERVARPSA